MFPKNYNESLKSAAKSLEEALAHIGVADFLLTENLPGKDTKSERRDFINYSDKLKQILQQINMMNKIE